MKAKVSELMDGELEPREAARLIGALPAEDEGMRAWKTYHLIRDAMRSDAALSSSATTDRILASLEAEPVVLAPGAAGEPEHASGHRNRRMTMALSAAASAAAIGIVAWLALTPPPAAQGPSMAAQAVTVPSAPPVAARVPLPEETQNYLLAHQGYSPRGSLQGMAPYVRTVSEQIPAQGAAR